MVKILRYLSNREKRFMGIVFIIVCVQVWFDLKLPDYMSNITMLVQTPNSAIRDITIAGMGMLACALGSLVMAFSSEYFVAQIVATLSRNLRSEVYNKTLGFSMEEINQFSTASLITRSTNDINQVQMFIMFGMIAFIRAPLSAAWAIIKIAGKNMSFTLATAGAVACLFLVVTIILVLALPKSKIIQELTDKLNLVTREHLNGVRVVRAYNAEEYQQDKFNEANNDVTSANLFVNRVTAFIQPFMMFLMTTLTLSIYWIGAFLINGVAGEAKMVIFSEMVVFTSYAMHIIMAFMILTMTFTILPRSTVAANRILEVLDKSNKIVDGEGTEIATQKGTIEFKNVSFSYNNGEEPVLKDISFKVEQGQTVAFIGATGSGKTSIINLIPRFYDVQSGEILVDGINVKNYKQADLRKKIGLITQKATLFSGTITSNVTYGAQTNPQMQHIENAIETAQAKEFIEHLGLEGAVSQGGTNLSGGQKQRVSIARAIYRNPEIYIFDDSFSALDYKTDRMLRKALEEKTSDATKLIVAQRISTVKNADQIIVLDKGRIIDKGTHADLLFNCDIYREIAESQLSQDELSA
ncbi:multidrug ABC transporter ATP-binding protein [Candidatus Epulonipiscium fishelsonii]|uniref:Multidrug ABC transporter ATP-binding protein n=1 Tax=Candidatus Epulonipiscium fishelsonii TaxID=77094 RepID=A0ACC8XHU1_9FIRM|nr:multidrug ABC transporter ATP-binding protein [Epulopiscium sp. SCG-B05WGA-EpuloA1]ONI43022.1 multidrug ABC transporter ATP-binding protein [Epulopiscium sp. SCG-B11WGA-EpuloA1]